MKTDQLLDLVGNIYEAAADAELWPRVLQDIAKITHATAASLPVFESFGSPRPTSCAAFNLNDEFPREYARNYFQLNPYHAHSILAAEGKVMSGEMVVQEREFLRSAYYNDFLRRFNVCYHCGGTVLMEPPAVAILMINRPRCGGAFAQSELALLRPLMPHLKRAVQLQLRLSTAEAQRRGLLEALDALPTGVMLVDPRGKILLMNHTAEAILNENDGLRVSNQSLHAVQRSESAKLAETLCAAARTGASNGTHAGGAISISRPSLRRPYSLLVCPLRLTCNPFPGVAAAAVFVSDPDAHAPADHQVLRQLFGLTAAESRLAEALLQGSTLRQAAELLGITRNTAHSQLSAIFDKSSTHRQAELMRVLGRAVAGVKLSAIEHRAA